MTGQGAMKSVAFLPIALVLANLSGLAIGLLVPFLVSSAEYSTFAVTWGVGQLAASVAFEWIRFGVLRYSEGADEDLAKSRRSVSLKLYVAIAGVFLLIAALALAARWFHPVAGLVAVVTFYAACQGAFEGRQARARALFDDSFYSLSWVMRTFLSLLLSAGLAWLTGSGEAALLGLAASYPLTMIVMNRATRVPDLRGQLDRRQLAFLARYGFFAALATNLSMLLPTVLRTSGVAALGLSDAGGLLLAADLSQKAIAVVGLAVNIIMMQLSIKAVEFGDDAEVRRQSRMQMAATSLFVAPAALGFLLVQEPFIDLLISPDYHESYRAVIGLCCLAGGISAFRLFAIDPLFVALGNTMRSVAGPAVTIGVFMAALACLAPLGMTGATAIASALVLALAIGTLVAAIVLARTRPLEWPLADFAKIALGCGAMWLVSLIVPNQHGFESLAILLLACGGLYAIVILATNAVGIRTLAAGRIKHFSRKVS